MTHTTVCNMVAGAWFCLDWPRQLVLMGVAGVVLALLLVQIAIETYLSKTKELP